MSHEAAIGLSAAVDQISPFPCNDANVRIRQELPIAHREAALDTLLSRSSWLPTIGRAGDTRSSRFSISDAAFRENAIGNRFWENSARHPDFDTRRIGRPATRSFARKHRAESWLAVSVTTSGSTTPICG